MSFILQTLTFEQFLQVAGDTNSLELYREIPFPNYGYEKLLKLFHLYCLVGGIPEVVESFASTRSIPRLTPLYDEQMERLFSQAVSVASTQKTRERLLQIYQDTFPFAATRVTLKGFSDPGFRSREVGRAFRHFEHLHLLRLIYPTTKTSLPWNPDTRRSPRLQLPDTGLVTYFTGIQHVLQDSRDLSAVFNRQISLHIVGQELLASELETEAQVHFWVRQKTQSSAEVDFVIEYAGLMMPVEVKPGEPGRLRSLHQFVDEAPHPYAIRLYAGPLAVKESRTLRGKTFYLMSLPYFLAGKIREHLEGFIKFVNW
ncbi:MAG: DUF4143 domain-containing protein [Bacteroidota bacterium]